MLGVLAHPLLWRGTWVLVEPPRLSHAPPIGRTLHRGAPIARWCSQPPPEGGPSPEAARPAQVARRDMPHGLIHEHHFAAARAPWPEQSWRNLPALSPSANPSEVQFGSRTQPRYEMLRIAGIRGAKSIRSGVPWMLIDRTT